METTSQKKPTPKKPPAKPKGRRSAAVKKGAAPKKKKTIDKPKDLFEKRVDGHKKIAEVAAEAYEAQVQREAWQEDETAAKVKLAALVKKAGIKGPYNADGVVVKPKHTQEKLTCSVKKVEEKGDDD